MRYTTIFLLSLMSWSAAAQTTVILQPGPEEGIDTKIWDLVPEAYVFGEDHELIALSWFFQFQEEYGIFRGLLRFDLSEIPADATILEAKLNLYHNSEQTNPGHAGANATVLFRALSDWDEATASWLNQPDVDTTDAITLPTSVEEDQNYLQVDVLDHVQQMVSNPAGNFGWSIRLADEGPSSSMKFCSSDCPDSIQRPRLEITYTVVNTIAVNFQPNGQACDDAVVSEAEPEVNDGEASDFMASSVIGPDSTSAERRSYLNVDLSEIPPSASILHAALTLHSNEASAGVGHSGNNAAYLSRVTEPWDESTITWANQPAFTSENEVLLPASLYADEDYIRVDVTGMVADMIADPETGHGFVIRLANPDVAGQMQFASSDESSDPALRPQLEVCYTLTTSIRPLDIGTTRIQPNPFTGSLTIYDLDGTYALRITDMLGRIVYRQASVDLSPGGTTIQPHIAEPGVYVVTVERGQDVRMQKVLRQ